MSKFDHYVIVRFIAFYSGMHSFAHVLCNICKGGDPYLIILLLYIPEIFPQHFMRQCFISNTIYTMKYKYQPVILMYGHRIYP